MKKLLYKLRNVPLILSVCAIVWSVSNYCGDSLPYQDPKPDMLVRQAEQLAFDEKLIVAGIIIFALSLIFKIVIARRNRVRLNELDEAVGK